MGFSNYPSNFNTFGGGMPTGIWYWTPEQLAAYNSPANVNRNPATRIDWNSMFEVHEIDTAAYRAGRFQGQQLGWERRLALRAHGRRRRHLHGRERADSRLALFGLRHIHRCPHLATAYNDVLPSANLKIDLTPDLVARFAAAETMTRADYSALAGFTSLAPPGAVGEVGAGSGGNPDLKPILSTNLDAGLDWYFAKHSLLSATAFYMDLHNYVSYGTVTKNYFTYSTVFPNGAIMPYLLTVPVNAQGPGLRHEFSYQQAFTDNIGIIANYTYADGKQTSDVHQRRRSTGGHLEEHLQHHGLLREQALQRARRLQLPFLVLQRSRPKYGVHSVQHRRSVGVFRLHHQP